MLPLAWLIAIVLSAERSALEPPPIVNGLVVVIVLEVANFPLNVVQSVEERYPLTEPVAAGMEIVLSAERSALAPPSILIGLVVVIVRLLASFPLNVFQSVEER